MLGNEVEMMLGEIINNYITIYTILKIPFMSVIKERTEKGRI